MSRCLQGRLLLDVLMLTCYLLFVYHILSVCEDVYCPLRLVCASDVWSIYVQRLLTIRVCVAVFYLQHSPCWMSFMSRWRLDMRIPTAWERLLFNSFTTYSNTHTISNQEPCIKISTFQTCIHGFKLCFVHMKRLISLNKHWPIINQTSFTGKKTKTNCI